MGYNTIPYDWTVWLPGALTRKDVHPQTDPLKDASGKEVFIVHGHDSSSTYDLANFLVENGLKPIILKLEANQGQAIIEKFEKYASSVKYAIVLLTPDDVGGENQHNMKLKPRARQNVILEMGYFMGILGRDRVCCVCKGEVEAPV